MHKAIVKVDKRELLNNLSINKAIDLFDFLGVSVENVTNDGRMRILIWHLC